MSVMCARGAVPRSARSAGTAHSMSPTPPSARTTTMRSALTLTSCWGIPAREGVTQGALGRPEREFVPGQLGGRVGADLGRLLGGARRAEGLGGEHDQHDALVGARVHADQPVELDVHLELLSGLASRRLLDRFAEVDEAAGEGPAAGARVEGPPEEDDAALLVARDGRGDGLGVVVGAVAAVRARQ